MARNLSLFGLSLAMLLPGCGPAPDAGQEPPMERAAHLDFHRGKLPAESIDATALGVRSTTPLQHPRVSQPEDNAATARPERRNTTP
jgi:hypothetical protein